MAYAATKNKMLKLLISAGACDESLDWVASQRTNNAEAIWLRCNNLEWLMWVANSAHYNKKLEAQLCRHLAQTSLDVLGEKFVRTHDLSNPFESSGRQRIVGYRAYTAQQGRVTDTQFFALYVLHYVCLFGLVPVMNTYRMPKNLVDLYTQDIKHCVSWEDACKLLERRARDC